MRKEHKQVAGILLLALSLAIGGTTARAEFESIAGTFTIAAAASSGSVSLTLGKTNIRDICVFVPESMSASTTTLALTKTVFTGKTVVPNGWTNKTVLSTQDDAVINPLAAVTNIFVDGTVTLSASSTTTQTAVRTFEYRFYNEF